MDISPVSGVIPTLPVDQHALGQEAQILVLKKALAMQAQGVDDLLQALPANLPLASSGPLGTQLNFLA